MLVGYVRVSKADGSQLTDLQRDALVAAGVGPETIYDDHASGKGAARPGLETCLKVLRPGDMLVIKPVAFYRYVGPSGELCDNSRCVFEAKATRSSKA